MRKAIENFFNSLLVIQDEIFGNSRTFFPCHFGREGTFWQLSRTLGDHWKWAAIGSFPISWGAQWFRKLLIIKDFCTLCKQFLFTVRIFRSRSHGWNWNSRSTSHEITFWRNWRHFELQIEITCWKLSNVSKIRNYLGIFLWNVKFSLIDNENPARMPRNFGWTAYYTLDQIYAWVDSLPAQHSGVSVRTIGTSTQGRPIKMVAIERNPVIIIQQKFFNKIKQKRFL